MSDKILKAPVEAMRIARKMWPPDDPIYQPCNPPLSHWGLMAIVDTAWSGGYQRGFRDAGGAAQPVNITHKPKVVTRSDKGAILERIRLLATAMAKELEGRAAMLVDLEKTQHRLFAAILSDLESYDPSSLSEGL